MVGWSVAYLAGALEVGGVGLDELMRVHVLHRPRRRIRHPAAAAAVGGGEERGGSEGAAAWGARVLGRSGWERIYTAAGLVAGRRMVDGRLIWPERVGLGSADGLVWAGGGVRGLS